MKTSEEFRAELQKVERGSIWTQAQMEKIMSEMLLVMLKRIEQTCATLGLK